MGECEGGETMATPERILANTVKGLRECERGETMTVYECMVCDCVDSWRYYDGGDIGFLPHYANNHVPLNVQFSRHRVLHRPRRPNQKINLHTHERVTYSLHLCEHVV